MMVSRIVGTGASLPSCRVTSASIESQLGLEEGWIKRRTGVVSRPVASVDEAVSDLAIPAARAALQEAPSNMPVGLVLLATSTPDHLLPPTAPRIAHELGLSGCGAVDVTGACAGALYALSMADAHCRAHGERVLVIAANILTRRVNPKDPATAALFADGAGAVVLDPTEDASGARILATATASQGAGWEKLLIPAGGSRESLTPENVAAGAHQMHINDGGAVFRAAIALMVTVGNTALQKAGMCIDDVDVWIPHQANARLIKEAGKRLGVAPEKAVSIVAEYGNASAASVLIALDHAARNGHLSQGDTVLLTAAGAGFTAAGAVVRW